jgi:hypothetical protein
MLLAVRQNILQQRQFWGGLNSPAIRSTLKLHDSSALFSFEGSAAMDEAVGIGLWDPPT